MAEIAVVAGPFTTGSHVSARAVASAEARKDARAAFRRTSRGSVEAGRKQRERLVDGEQRRGGEVLSGDPLREGNLDRPVDTGCRVHLVNGSEAPSGKPVSDTHKSRPDPAMDQDHLPIDQARRHHLARVENGSEHREDLMAGRVPPPAPADRLTGDPLGQTRERSPSGLQHHPLRAHPIQRIHEPPIQTRDIGISRRRHPHSAPGWRRLGLEDLPVAASVPTFPSTSRFRSGCLDRHG
jgi:hypothetical protein